MQASYYWTSNSTYTNWFPAKYAGLTEGADSERSPLRSDSEPHKGRAGGEGVPWVEQSPVNMPSTSFSSLLSVPVSAKSRSEELDAFDQLELTEDASELNKKVCASVNTNHLKTGVRRIKEWLKK